MRVPLNPRRRKGAVIFLVSTTLLAVGMGRSSSKPSPLPADHSRREIRPTGTQRTQDVSARLPTGRVSPIRAPVIAQRLHNNCEATALQILLATVGVHAGQLELQRDLAHSLPLDPIGTGLRRVWGDPERGFVGRADGGGPAGGFGVYQRPVATLASRRGYVLTDLTRSSPGAIYRRLATGHAVMAWIALSAGPYGTWRTREGSRVRVNFGEHTVVLVGLAARGSVRIVNPLGGTRETWTRSDFEHRWRMLGRRALAT